MQAFDVEIGPIQSAFEHLFASISLYFQSAPVVPTGSVIETDLSSFSQEKLHETLNSALKSYGFTFLPAATKVVAEDSSVVSGISRSDGITTYEEKMADSSTRTFNFYGTNGPEDMKASYYWLDNTKNGEKTWGILTKNDKLYLRVSTQFHVFYQRIEKGKS